VTDPIRFAEGFKFEEARIVFGAAGGALRHDESIDAEHSDVQIFESHGFGKGLDIAICADPFYCGENVDITSGVLRVSTSFDMSVCASKMNGRLSASPLRRGWKSARAFESRTAFSRVRSYATSRSRVVYDDPWN
jgi:hypothetical protein